MELSEEQRRRMDANRAAAIARRQEIQQRALLLVQDNAVNSSKVVELVLELCSSFEFFVMPTDGFIDEDKCIVDSIFERFSHLTTSWKSIKARSCPVFKLRTYDSVVDILRRISGLKLHHIPWSTRKALKPRIEPSRPGEWLPFHTRHVSDAVVDQLLANMHRKLRNSLLPFQWQGIRYGLRRGGRVLIADEMGVGKTIQAIGIASCYLNEGPLLVVCPASLRLMWAEELERWIPTLRPSDLHIVFGKKDDLHDEANSKVVVISYNMLKRLRSSMSKRQWQIVIVDESHNLRCSRRQSDCEETTTVVQIVQAAQRAILLTGTPSLSRPFDIYNQVDCLWKGILGRNKFEFGSNYCGLDNDARQKDFTKGVRLEELNFLLTEAVMIRRLKSHLLKQLPPKRRQVIRLKLTPADVFEAKAHCSLGYEGLSRPAALDDRCSDEDGNQTVESGTDLTLQELGFAKLSGIREWLSINLLQEESQKIVVFGHHHKVLNNLQKYFMENGVEYVRIDGTTDAKDRQKAVETFRNNVEAKVAIVSVTAGGVGLDLSAAQTLVFAELPKTASDLLQAEDRAHRRGQKNAVNIYIFCAKDTADETHWQQLNKSLERVTTMTNGAADAVPDLKIVSVDDKSRSEVIYQFDPDAVTAEVSSLEKQNEDVQVLECEDACKVQYEIGPEQLMFEMSSNTGRLHLYKRTYDQGSAIIPLQENFKTEDLESSSQLHLPACLRESSACRDAALAFLNQWAILRPVQRKKLYGRPLRLPLSTELARTREQFSFAEGGLVSGGSRRRARPRHELACPLPEGATMEEKILRFTNPAKEVIIRQPCSRDGKPLCKLCHREISGSCSLQPLRLEDFFCRKSCFQEHKLKTSPQYLRQELFELERGICTNCDLDCHALVECIRNLPMSERGTYIIQKAPFFSEHQILLDRLVKDPREGNAWHADHIVPVYAGGGECGLENLRTLCVICHAKVTSEQCQRRSSAALKAQRTLRFSIEKMLADGSKRLKTDEESDGDGDDDRELLSVEVAGSAYS